MNALEMQYAFELRTGQVDSFEGNRIDSDKIQDLLNVSQNQEIQDRYSKYLGSSLTKFDFTEKLRRELSNLITSVNKTSFDSSDGSLHKNAVFVMLPSDYLYGVEERCVVSDSSGSTGVAQVMPITYDEYLVEKDNPFLEPNDELVWRLDYGVTGATGIKKHELISGDDITIDSYTVRYLRRPQDIIIHPTNKQDCELDESIHDNIVNRAVQMAVGNINRDSEQ